MKRTKNPSSIEEQLKDLTEVNTPTVLTIYGKPGTGKTTFAGTLPKPLLLIDVKDKGTDSMRHQGLEAGDITVLELAAFSDIYEAYNYIKDNPKKYKSVVIDHMTALQEYCSLEVMEDEGKDSMSQRLYGLVSGKIREVILLYKGLTDLGIVPCFLCEDRMESGEGEGEDQLTPEVGPGLMPSVSRTICASSRVIGHTYLQEKVTTSGNKVNRVIEYRLRLGPNPYYITKLTRPKDIPCPSYISNPTYDKLNSVMKGGREKVSRRPRKSRR